METNIDINQVKTNDKMLNTFINRINHHYSLVIPTSINIRQFETNCRNNFIAELLMKNFQYLLEWKNNIGKMVYKFKNREQYSVNPSTSNNFNPTEDTPILFTEELFEQLKIYMVKGWINYHTKEFIENAVTRNSTHKLSNLLFEWGLEEKQEAIRFYNSLLENFSQ